jgi:hypothetical protein
VLCSAAQCCCALSSVLLCCCALRSVLYAAVCNALCYYAVLYAAEYEFVCRRSSRLTRRSNSWSNSRRFWTICTTERSSSTCGPRNNRRLCKAISRIYLRCHYLGCEGSILSFHKIKFPTSININAGIACELFARTNSSAIIV